MDIILSHYIITPLILGFILDSLIGDPKWFPHPIRLFGNSIAFAEKRFNKGDNRKLKGAIVAASLIALTYLFIQLILLTVKSYSTAYLVIASIGVFYGLANHGLIKEALKVEKSLQTEGVEKARIKLSYIVGRETSKLSPQQIRIAILETLAENLSDGVIAPLFYYAIGGVPLMLTFKMVNTLDSMIGYKSERYKQFGWFAAKTDDFFNFIPARITAILMSLISFSLRGFKHIVLYGSKHASPNAGYPEAALSGILNTQFGGPNMYHGKQVNKPYIGINDRELKHSDIIKACIINALTALAFTLIILSIMFYIYE